MTYISCFSDFAFYFYYNLMENCHTWIIISKWQNDLHTNTSRSVWPILYGLMIKMLQYKMYPAGELAVLRQLLLYESFPIENLMTFETSTDKIQYAHPRSLCIGAVWSGSTHIANRMHYVSLRCQQAVWILRFKTAEILISLRFSHLNSVHLTFEERDFCVSVVVQTRTNVR